MVLARGPDLAGAGAVPGDGGAAHTSWLCLGPREEKQGPGAHFLAGLGGVGDPN